MTARILSKKKPESTPLPPLPATQPIEVLRTIKSELEKSGSEAYFIGKRVEDALAQVYFSSAR